MKRFVVLAVVLALLVVMVSSVSANIVGDPPEEDVVPTDQFSLNNIVAEPPRPTGGATGGDVVPTDQFSLKNIVIDPPAEEGKATPILFGSEADSGDDLPTEEVSLNGGTLITIIVTSG